MNCQICKKYFQSNFHLKIHNEVLCIENKETNETLKFENMYDEVLITLCEYLSYNDLKNLVSVFPYILTITGITKLGELKRFLYGNFTFQIVYKQFNSNRIARKIERKYGIPFITKFYDDIFVNGIVNVNSLNTSWSFHTVVHTYHAYLVQCTGM